MYLSLLPVNTTDRPGREWLRNVYRVHQRLWMAFPEAQTRLDDPFFLGPWTGPPGPEQRARRTESGFLFRIEHDGSPRILVQSMFDREPDWDYAFQNAPYLLAGRAQTRRFEPIVAVGQLLRFRLRANPTRRASLSRQERLDRAAAGQRVQRPRLQLTWAADEDPRDAFMGWLFRKAQTAGFAVRHADVLDVGYAYFKKKQGPSKAQPLRAVEYEGVLEVNDVEGFRGAIVRGIGPAKAFGFGLLSVAPVKAG